MRLTRCHIDTDLIPGSEFELPESVRHHLINVLRHKEKHQLTVFNGRDDCEASAVITRVEKKRANIRIDSISEVNRESSLHLTLVQAIGKGEKMEFSIQKAVELGVTEIVPLFSERSVKSLSGERLQKKQHHWQAVAISAAEQSGRTRITKVQQALSLGAYLSNGSHSKYQQLMLMPDATTSLTEISIDPTNQIHILIGPEGGFSDTELELAQQSGVQAVRMGPRVLRTETAGMTALSLLQNRFGDLN